jgi:hypothetical protein
MTDTIMATRDMTNVLWFCLLCNSYIPNRCEEDPSFCKLIQLHSSSKGFLLRAELSLHAFSNALSKLFLNKFILLLSFSDFIYIPNVLFYSIVLLKEVYENLCCLSKPVSVQIPLKVNNQVRP